MGRLLNPSENIDEAAAGPDQLVDSLIDALHNPRFMILADPSTPAPSLDSLTVQ